MSEMTLQDVADKIGWEGGFAAVLDYGLKPEDVPEEIRPLWQKAWDAYQQLNEIWIELEKVLPEEM